MISDLLTVIAVLFGIVAWNANRPWSMALFSALAFLALAATLIENFFRKPFRLRACWMSIPFSLFLLLGCIQYFNPRQSLDALSGFFPHSVEPYATGLYLLVACGCCALIFCMVNGFRSRKQIARLVQFMLVIGILEALYGLVQFLGGVHSIWGTPVRDNFAHGTIPNHNHYALLLNIAIAIGVGLFYQRAVEMLRDQKFTLRSLIAMPEAPRLIWLLIWLAILGLGVFASASRAGVVAMLGCLVFMILAIGSVEDRKYATALAFCVVIAIIGLGLYAGVDAVTERFSDLSQPGNLEGSRTSLWSDAWRMVWNTPWFGKGLGSFQWTFRAYETANPDIPAIYAHNDYLQVVAETGLVGLGLALWAFAACWRTARKNLHAGDPLVRGIGLAAIGALCAAAIQEFTDYALYIPGTAAWFSLLIGLNERARWLRRDGARL
jgi:O-antigen ligase